MTLPVLHCVTRDSYPKTLCGIRIEGVHRVHPRFLKVHLARGAHVACVNCSTGQLSLEVAS